MLLNRGSLVRVRPAGHFLKKTPILDPEKNQRRSFIEKSGRFADFAPELAWSLFLAFLHIPDSRAAPSSSGCCTYPWNPPGHGTAGGARSPRECSIERGRSSRTMRDRRSCYPWVSSPPNSASMCAPGRPPLARVASARNSPHNRCSAGPRDGLTQGRGGGSAKYPEGWLSRRAGSVSLIKRISASSSYLHGSEANAIVGTSSTFSTT